MQEIINPALLDWSRAQFALTAGYHWLFVPLTLGLAFIMACMETLYYKTGDEFWKKTAQFWMKLFGINFAIGVATGIILEFEFGTNWSNYSWFVGDIFGAPLAIEGIVAFFMEATFIAVMFFGWEKVSKRFHLISTWLTGIGATLSAWWILVANSWMQHPVGMTFNPATVRNEMMDFFAVAFSKSAVLTFCHTVMSAWLTGAIFVIGVSGWYLLKKREKRFALSSIKVATVFGLVSALATAFTGDLSGIKVAETQPMKLAAMEGLQVCEKTAPLTIVPGVKIPSLLSLLAKHDADAFIPGIQDILNGGYKLEDGTIAPSAEERIANGKVALKAFADFRAATKAGNEQEAAQARQILDANIKDFGYGYLQSKEDLVPNVTIVFWAFRIMVGVGMLLLGLFFFYGFLVWKKTDLSQSKWRWLHKVAIVAIPLTYIGGQAGWVVTEVGRQPWAIQDLLPVNAAISHLSVSSVQLTFFLFLALFTVLLVIELRILFKAIQQGPNINA